MEEEVINWWIYNSHTPSSFLFSSPAHPSFQSDFMMDMYLSSHIETLYAEIRSRAVCQYLAPFSRVDLVRMATAFGVNSSSSSADADSVAVRALENEIALLVGDGLIEGRIDRYNKVCTYNERGRLIEGCLTF